MVREGQYKSHTSGQAQGFLQCNLVIVPEAYARAFELFCKKNAKACPLIAKSLPGSYDLPELGDIDLRFDVPSYEIFEHGERVRQENSIESLWRDDFVAFALGCSYSFEEAFLNAGLEIRNITDDVCVPMYRTRIRCEPVPPFDGQVVVSMRPFLPGDVQSAIDISSCFPKVHGAPLHVGDPVTLGINDLNTPDFGCAINLKEDEVPLFWACGVTPQLALLSAKLPLAITHSPGCMLVTDIKNDALKIY
ncbi:MAG: putative hydro-lyase [Cellvibrionales bacterium]|nr:putative hydro-lyase [Cellvibrionales bacterium]